MSFVEPRANCCVCRKLADTCKTCTFAKISFYARRMDIDQNSEQKKQQAQEIERLLGETVKLGEESNNLTANISSLKMEIERRRNFLKAKKIQLKTISKEKNAIAKKNKGVEIAVQNADKAREATEQAKQENHRTVEKMMTELNNDRTVYAQSVFAIYPLRIKETPDEVIYCVRNARLPSTLLSSLLPDASSLALLVYSSHIVMMLSRILDLPLPCQLTVQSFASKQEEFRSQWTKLCICARYLCSKLGMEAAADPHEYLMELFIQLQSPLQFTSSLHLVRLTHLEHAAAQAGEEEELPSSEWDTCEDFEVL